MQREGIDGGGLVIELPGSRNSVYVAYPDSDIQVELFSPRPGQAESLAVSGAVAEIG